MKKATPTPRKLKQEVFGQPQEVRIYPAPGWLDVLEDELKSIKKAWILPGKFTPECFAEDNYLVMRNLDFRNMLELPFRLRTAADVFWMIRSRHVGSFAELVQFYQSIPWELYLPASAVVHLRMNSYRSKLFHEEKLKSLWRHELTERGFQCEGESPLRLLGEQRENRHAVLMSLSREALYHRHYKVSLHHIAPLSEHLAASCLHWFFKAKHNSDWDPDICYIPFAGSGTFLAETLLALGVFHPFCWRPASSLEDLPAFPGASVNHIRKILQQSATALRKEFEFFLVERDPIQFAELEKNIHFILGADALHSMRNEVKAVSDDAFLYKLPVNRRRVLLLLNPPYGLRLADDVGFDSAMGFYLRLAELLKSLAKDQASVRGIILVPDGVSIAKFLTELKPALSYHAVHGFTQGGQYIRCVMFDLEGGMPAIA